MPPLESRKEGPDGTDHLVKGTTSGICVPIKCQQSEGKKEQIREQWKEMSTPTTDGGTDATFGVKDTH